MRDLLFTGRESMKTSSWVCVERYSRTERWIRCDSSFGTPLKERMKRRERRSIGFLYLRLSTILVRLSFPIFTPVFLSSSVALSILRVSQ